MSDHDGSRWYFPTYEGLYDAKHVEQMGPAIWLYGWILARTYAAQRDGVMAYSHREAADALGVTYRTIQLWFERLQEYGYLTTRARHPHHLDVAVTNWRSVEEWHEARTEADGIARTDRKEISSPGVETGKVSGKVSGKILPLPHISIKLQNYSYPTGSDERASLAGAFAWILDLLKNTRNKQPILQEIYALCFGDDPPEYGYIGRVARTVAGAGRLAEIMWQLATKPPTGDVMAYVLKVYGPKRNDKNNGHHEQDNDAWANMDVQAVVERNAIAARRNRDRDSQEQA